MWMIFAAMAVLFVAWTVAAAVLRRRSFSVQSRWKLVNVIVLVMALLAVVAGTLLSREGRERCIIWQLGSMFRMYGVSSEAWRLLIMNCSSSPWVWRCPTSCLTACRRFGVCC